MADFFRAAVLGHPIDHSLSPMMHRYWLEQAGIEGEYTAVATDGSFADFSAKIGAMRASGFAGCNVTLPHKGDAHRLCTWCAPEAERTGSVNTLVFGAEGIRGYNTDIYGFGENLRGHRAYSAALETGHATVVGAGGTTRSVVYMLLEAGFQQLTIVNRTVLKARGIKTRSGRFFPAATIEVASWDQLQSVVDRMPVGGLLVNTTSIGLSGGGAWSLEVSRRLLMVDVLYTPLRTSFLELAQRTPGVETQDGLGMLIHQGAAAFEIWTGRRPTVDGVLRKRLEQCL